MAQDRYTQWLKIPPGERPPDHYTLLGLPQFCDDAQRIAQASHDRLDQLDKYALSNDPASREDCQRIMNEVARARVVLTDAGKRMVHDVALAAKLGIAPPQVTIMPAQEPLEAGEQSPGQVENAPGRQSPKVARPAPARVSQVGARQRQGQVPAPHTTHWPAILLLLIGGAVVGMIAVLVMLITFLTKDGETPSPHDLPAPPITLADSQPAGDDVIPDKPAALTSLDMKGRARKLPGVGQPIGPLPPMGSMRLVPVGEPFKGPYHVRYLQFSPNAKVLAAGGQNEMLLWDVDAGSPYADKSKLPEPAGIIYFTFSPDGTKLHHFTRADISSWDLSNLQAPPTRSESWKMGGPLVVGGRFVGTMMPGQKVIEIWDVMTSQPVSQLRHDSKLQFHAISDDGKITITLDESRTHFRVWETESGRKVLTPPYPYASNISGFPGSRISLSPDGRLIACCDKYHVQFVATDDNATAKKPLDLTGRRKGGGGIEKLQYSPDGRHLLITLYDQNLDPSMRRSVLIYDMLENRIVGEAHPSGDDGQGRFPRPTLQCSPDGRLMATGGATGVLRIVGLDTGKPVTGDINIGSTIWDIAFSHDSKLLAVLYVDALVRIYRLEP